MSTLTIELTDDLAARLAAASARQQVPPAQVVQEALAKALPELPEGKSLYDAMMEMGAIGCFDSGVIDLATNPKYMEGFGQWQP